MHCTNRKESREVEQRKLKKTYAATRHSYGAGVYFDEDKGRLIPYSCNNKSIRQMVKRKVRRTLNRQTDWDEASAVSESYYRKAGSYWNAVI